MPVLVGALSRAAEKTFGDIFAPYLDDPANLFVVSSDFCHWGKRFGYTPFLQLTNETSASSFYEKTVKKIHESIEALDRRGMALIETKDADGFAAYLE